MSVGKPQRLRADGVCVRTPMLPLGTLVEWAAAADPRSYLSDMLARPEVDEAIFLASPQLHGQIAAWRAKPTAPANVSIERSLGKYLARMAGRSTPFGLFSGISVGGIGGATTVSFAPRSEYRRRTRLDNDYLFALIDALLTAPELRAQLVYRPSTSLYRIAGMIRYAEARLAGKERSYRLASAESTPHLEATLERAKNGARLADLAAPLVDGEITADDAREFIDALVTSQVLVPDLGIHITGVEPLAGVIAALPEGERARAVLDEVRTALRNLDASGVGVPSETYRAIAATLEPLPAKADLARLFQVDLVKPASITLGTKILSEVAQTIGKLARIARSGPEDGSLAAFRTAFVARWEEREVPLSEVLDEESGIGFEAAQGPGSEGSPLLAGIAFPARGGDGGARFRGMDAFLLRRLTEALRTKSTEIVLTDADLEGLALDRAANLPHAFSAQLRIAATPEQLAAGQATVLFQGTSGPSGATLLGRFCHASPEMETMVRAHHAGEEAARPDAVFAEIVHLNEGRIGNVTCRPVLRDYEIVYLGVSGAPRDHQITLDDLLVSVRDGRIVLRSRRLGREVIPRLTNAHNYRLRTLGVYRFLCALASQGIEHAPFGWGAIGGAPYLPRVRIGNVLLSRAVWNLGKDDLAPITAAVKAEDKGGRGEVATAIAALRTRLSLPRFVVLADWDNELPIDLDNPLLVAVLADEVAKRTGARLIELFPTPDALIAMGPEGGFSSEVMVTYTRTDVTAETAKPTPVSPTVRRAFGPGSEWLYAKIYSGVTMADRVLREAIAPVVREAIGAGDADRWFFIRYNDPDSHLRVRFHGEPGRLAGRVLPALERALTPLIEQGVARKLMLDTYERETERYGGDEAIDLVEQLFHHDSDAVLGIVELLDGDAGGDARWRLAVRGMATLLEELGIDLAAREKIVSDGRDMIGKEVGAHTALWKRIGDRFVQERASLEILFERKADVDAAHDLEPGFTLIAARDAAQREVVAELLRRDAAKRLTPPVQGFAWSLLHMHANRLLHASQRAQEMVLYDFLRRMYASRRARNKAAQ